jgi:hypothetical protein
MNLLKDETWFRTREAVLMDDVERQIEEAVAERLATLATRREARCIRERELRDAGVGLLIALVYWWAINAIARGLH